MTSNLFRLAFLFLTLVMVQVLLLNNVLFSGYINPYLYIYFILALPFGTPRWAVLFLAFILGFVIDIFSDTAGMHAAATTFLGYIRYHVLNLLKPREGYDVFKLPSVRHMGFSWYIFYTVLLVLLHHLVYFTVEVFRIREFEFVMLRVLLSTGVTFLLVMLVQLLFGKQRDAE